MNRERCPRTAPVRSEADQLRWSTPSPWSFLRQAEERRSQLPLLTSVVVRYGVAGDACHDTGEALLAAYGFPTTNGPDRREALGRYLRAVLDALATRTATR